MYNCKVRERSELDADRRTNMVPVYLELTLAICWRGDNFISNPGRDSIANMLELSSSASSNSLQRCLEDVPTAVTK